MSAGSHRTSPGSDKPLPSPPVLTVVNTAPENQSRSLIDAAERPLRRSPKDDSFNRLEEWPVLFPEKPTTPSTLEKMFHPSETINSRMSDRTEIERYPSISRLASKSSTASKSPRHARGRRPRLSVNGGASADTIVVKKSRENGSSVSKDKESAKAVVDGPDASTPVASGSVGKPSLHRSAKGVVPPPRQTRTSMLRATMSAEGHYGRYSSSNTKPGNFVENSSSSQQPPSLDTTTALPTAVRASTASGHYASARTASSGSRRSPVVHRASNSSLRYSMNSSKRSSSRFGSFSRAVSKTAEEITEAAKSRKEPGPSERSKKSNAHTVRRRSALPQPRLPASRNGNNVSDHRSGKVSVSDGQVKDSGRRVARESPSTKPRPTSMSIPLSQSSNLNNKHDMFEEHVADRVSKAHPNINDTVSTSGDLAGVEGKSRRFSIPAFRKSKLETNFSKSRIDDVNEPIQRYSIRRLSLANPIIGPTLKIHCSAEKLIMGPDGEHEVGADETSTSALASEQDANTEGASTSTSTVRPGTLSRRPTFKELNKIAQNATKRSDSRIKSSRAASSEEVPQSTTDSRLPRIRNHKRASTISGPSSPLAPPLVLPGSQPLDDPPKAPKSFKNGKIVSASQQDDPFVDKRSVNADAAVTKLNKAVEELNSITKLSIVTEGVSPMSERRGSLLRNDISESPVSMTDSEEQSHIKQMTKTIGRSRSYSSFPDLRRQSLISQHKKCQGQQESVKEQPEPLTPKHSQDHNVATEALRSHSFPTRSTSRNAVLDFTNEATVGQSNSPIQGVQARRLDTVFNHLNSDDGMEGPHFTSPEKKSEDPKNVVTKRESQTSMSTKSQASTKKKGVFRNVRGLFSKRPADAKGRTNSTPGESQGVNIGDVHPVLRSLAAGPGSKGLSLLPSGFGSSSTEAELSSATATAMSLLETARVVRDTAAREALVETSRGLVSAITLMGGALRR